MLGLMAQKQPFGRNLSIRHFKRSDYLNLDNHSYSQAGVALQSKTKPLEDWSEGVESNKMAKNLNGGFQHISHSGRGKAVCFRGLERLLESLVVT